MTLLGELAIQEPQLRVVDVDGRRALETVRGLTATAAIAKLRFGPGQTCEPVARLIETAVARAERAGVGPDQLVVIGRGRLVADQPVAEFIARSSGQYVRVKTPQVDALTTAVVDAGGRLAPSEDGALEVNGLSAAAIGDLAASLGIPLHELTPQMASLEEAFMELTHDSVEFHGEGSPAIQEVQR